MEASVLAFASDVLRHKQFLVQKDPEKKSNLSVRV